MNIEPLTLGAVLPPALLSLVAAVALVFCDYRGIRPGRFLFKPLAALAFVWLGLRLGGMDSSYGQWLMGGLVLCLFGDLFLMPEDERCFLAGLGAFLCGHLLYAIAFMQLPLNTIGLVVSAVPAVLLMTLVLRWLMPHVAAGMKLPVLLYTSVITLMLLCAGLSVGHAAASWIIVGAWGFAASDIAVARQQFVAPGHSNRLWGTPLYFFAQMIIAASIAFV